MVVAVVGDRKLVDRVLPRLDESRHVRLSSGHSREDRVIVLGLLSSEAGGGSLENNVGHSVSFSQSLIGWI